jgi:hypothetical protein
VGRRDYVSGMMSKGKGPFRLVLNSSASKEIEWHTKHYVGRNLMVKFNHGKDLAKEMGISVEKLASTFKSYTDAANTKKCPFGKKFFNNSKF